MIRLVRLFSTSVGQKLVVGLTGTFLLVFLIGHMLGNMAVFQGPEALNSYAAWLSGHPLVWLARAGLLIVFLMHVVIALRLARENYGARSTTYQGRPARNAGFTSRYMVLTGLLVMAFLVYHLLHFTFGAVHPESYDLVDSANRHDVYAMVVGGFQSPLVAISYTVAMILLGIHLIHGAQSVFQTFGINHESYDVMIRHGSYAVVTIIVLGNCSIPLLILAGAVPLAEGN